MTPNAIKWSETYAGPKAFVALIAKRLRWSKMAMTLKKSIANAIAAMPVAVALMI